MARTWILGVVLVSLVASSARAGRAGRADRLKVAVIPGLAVNLDPARVDALGQDMAEALSSQLDVEVIGGLEVRRRLPAEGVPDECAVTPSCAGDIARVLDVDQLLFVVMVNTGASGSIQIDTTWVDPGLGGRASRPAIDIATVGTAKDRFAASATKLLPDAPVRPKASAPSLTRFSSGRPRHVTLSSGIAAGATVAALGVGLGFGLVTRSHYQDCKSVACSQDRKDSIRFTGIVADASFVVALAGAITTAVLFGTSAEQPRLLVAPSPDGVAVLGRVGF
jgi:hypothetical protein